MLPFSFLLPLPLPRKLFPFHLVILFRFWTLSRQSRAAHSNSRRITEATEVSIAEFEQFVQKGWNPGSNWTSNGLDGALQNPNGASQNRAAGRGNIILLLQ